MRARKPKEESIQIAVSTYLKMAYPKVIFTAESSGVRLTMGQAMKAKKQRSQRGLPDLMILEPNGKYAGLMIELKRDGQSPWKKKGGLKAGEHLEEQLHALQQLTIRGYYARFAVGFNQAKDIIDSYMRNQL